jgi:hypothetical protein
MLLLPIAAGADFVYDECNSSQQARNQYRMLYRRSQTGIQHMVHTTGVPCPTCPGLSNRQHGHSQTKRAESEILVSRDDCWKRQQNREEQQTRNTLQYLTSASSELQAVIPANHACGVDQTLPRHALRLQLYKLLVLQLLQCNCVLLCHSPVHQGLVSISSLNQLYGLDVVLS